MIYGFFLLGFVALALLLGLTYWLIERRGVLVFPMVELFVGGSTGTIYSIGAVCHFASWPYSICIVVDLVLGIVVGGALTTIAGVFCSVLENISKRR